MAGGFGLLGAIACCCLALPAALWRRGVIADRRLQDLEDRLAEARAENVRLEVALAEAQAKDAHRIAPLDLEARWRIPIQWQGATQLPRGTLRPDVLPGGAR